MRHSQEISYGDNELPLFDAQNDPSSLGFYQVKWTGLFKL
jgi:hypothetical protein